MKIRVCFDVISPYRTYTLQVNTTTTIIIHQSAPPYLTQTLPSLTSSSVMRKRSCFVVVLTYRTYSLYVNTTTIMVHQSAPHPASNTNTPFSNLPV